MMEEEDIAKIKIQLHLFETDASGSRMFEPIEQFQCQLFGITTKHNQNYKSTVHFMQITGTTLNHDWKVCFT